MNKLARLAPVVLLLLAGCDLWLPGDGDNDPDAADLVGEWNGTLVSGDPLLSSVTCEGDPVDTAALEFRLTAPSEGDPEDVLGGSGRLEMRAGQHTCITIQDYVTAFDYDYPDVRITFGANFALEGLLSEGDRYEGQYFIRGALLLGDNEISPFGVQREAGQ